MAGVLSNAAFDSRQGLLSDLIVTLGNFGEVGSLSVRKHFVQALVVRSVYCQLISVFPGYFGRLLAP